MGQGESFAFSGVATRRVGSGSGSDTMVIREVKG